MKKKDTLAKRYLKQSTKYESVDNNRVNVTNHCSEVYIIVLMIL